MATWITHLRIADNLLNAVTGISPIEFTVGNIAPDSGILNAEKNGYDPPSSVSHWKASDDHGVIYYQRQDFYDAYLRDKELDSFYLGYYIHLFIDQKWAVQIYRPCKMDYAEEFANDKNYIWTVKRDWYDLDFLYLRDMHGLKTLDILTSVNSFVNKYFSTSAKMLLKKK